jgi:hypothetical protein
MESVQKADNTHHTQRNVLSKFAVLEVFFNCRTDSSGVKAHSTKAGGLNQKVKQGDDRQVMGIRGVSVITDNVFSLILLFVFSKRFWLRNRQSMLRDQAHIMILNDIQDESNPRKEP